MDRKFYQLYTRSDGRWEWVCDIEAANHAEALREVTAALEPHHYEQPIRLEQSDGASRPAVLRRAGQGVTATVN